jgi:preprotein translocase subunit YajC
MGTINGFLLAGEMPGKSLFDTQQWSIIFIMVIFVGFFYFFIVRPQNKKRKETENMLNSMKKGDKIVTIGGMHGKVVSVKDNEIVVRVSDNTEISFEKSAIARVVSDKVPNKSMEPIKDDKKK